MRQLNNLSSKGFGILSFDEPVVGHDKLGAADHSSVDQDARFEPILSILGTESYWLYTFSYSIIQKKIENLEAYSPIFCFVVLNSFPRALRVVFGLFQIKMAPGVFNISVFVRVECGAWPLSDQNG